MYWRRQATDVRKFKRPYPPYKVSDEEWQRLERELKGHTAKVAAIVVLAENDGYVTQEEVAEIVGVARMTLYRWLRQDYVYQYELERQYELMSEHYHKAFLRSRRRPSASDILGDMDYLRAIYGLS